MINIKMDGKVGIVTGAASGLGKAIALRFAEAGANVAVADVDMKNASKTVDEIKNMGQKAFAFQIDTRDPEAFVKLVDTTTENLGGLDFLVNSAGIGIMKPILEFSSEEINRVIDIDLKGTLFGCKAALNYMIPKKSGRIVNLSSIAVRLATPGSCVYSSAKGGVLALTSALAREVAESNININAICPGIIRTKMWESQLDAVAGENNDKEKAKVFESYTNLIPLKRPQEPEDIANMALFLCSDFGKNITAQTFTVDGGTTV